jgi:anti-sigma factor RsiW
MPDLPSPLRWLRGRRRPGGRELTCQELVELVTDYLDGALAPAERARFEAHVSGCEGCAAYLEQMRSTLALLGALPADALSPQAHGELLAAFRGWRGA